MRFRWNNDWMSTLSITERAVIYRRVMEELKESKLSYITKHHTISEIGLLYRGYKCPNPLSEGTYILDTKPSVSDKNFPILLHHGHKYTKCPRSVPWAFVAPHEDQALLNHRQTLARLAERGGLDPLELLCVIQNKHWRELGLGQQRASTSQVEAAINEIVRRLEAWSAATFSLQTFHSRMKTFHS